MKKKLLITILGLFILTAGLLIAEEPTGEPCGKVASKACKTTNPRCNDLHHSRLGLDGETWYCCGQTNHYTGHVCKAIEQ